MEVSLAEFLVTGQLGSVHIGMSKEKVLKLLGDPDAMGGTSHRYPEPSIYLYGSVEFWFRYQKPHELVGIYWEAGTKGGFYLSAQCDKSVQCLTPESTFPLVEEFLKSKGLTFDRIENPMETIQLSSGIQIVFDDMGQLYSVIITF